MIFTLGTGKTSVFRRENGSSTVSRTITYRYNKLGELSYKKDSKTGLATTYFYDTYGRNIGMYENTDSPNASTLAAHRLRYVYDGLGRMETSTETYDGLLYTTAYAYNTNGQVNEVSAGKATQRYKYDKFERLTQSYIYHDGSYSYLLAKTVNYKSGTAGTSNQISSLVYEDSAENTIIYTYAYDANGNISSEKVGSYTTTYVYDSANQLIRENNQKAGKTWIWTYDNAGNIRYREEFPYSTDSLGSELAVVAYNYGNATWGDLLTKYNGKTITYDGVGNPLSDGTWAYTWEQGRQLKKISNGSTTWEYTYNADGMRTERTNGTITYKYTYHGSQLTHMKYGGMELHFTYDANGGPMAVVYNGNTYYYVLNLQGDVVGILNSSGTQVVSYTYDAWGRPLSTTGSLASTLGLHNPLRYRGYVYDRETNLYYLQSRYYNPTWGRFLNADSLVSTGQGTLGNNMFAYCENNPVNMFDPSGHWAEWFENAFKVVSAVVAVAAVATTVAAVSAFTAGTGTAAAVYAATIFLGAALSGINGAVANEANGNSYFNGYVGGAISGGIQSSAGRLPGGTVWGGALGTSTGTAVTMGLNNFDPYSANSTASEVATEVKNSAIKATATSMITAYIGACVGGIDYKTGNLFGGVADGCGGLMPLLTLGFGEGIKAFFGAVDDALVYIWG